MIRKAVRITFITHLVLAVIFFCIWGVRNVIFDQHFDLPKEFTITALIGVLLITSSMIFFQVLALEHFGKEK